MSIKRSTYFFLDMRKGLDLFEDLKCYQFFTKDILEGFVNVEAEEETLDTFEVNNEHPMVVRTYLAN